MKNHTLKFVLVSLVCLLANFAPMHSEAQPRHSQHQRYQQGYDDVYRQRGRFDQRRRDRINRRPYHNRCFVAPPPPIVRHRRMMRRMANRHFCRMCVNAPRYSHRCR